MTRCPACGVKGIETRKESRAFTCHTGRVDLGLPPVDVVLCEECLSRVLRNLGHLKHTGQLSGSKEGEDGRQKC